MAKKKNTSVSASQEEQREAQKLLEQYHQIATTLRASTGQKEIEIALERIENLPEGAQVALIKDLARENQTDAADVLAAIHEYGTLKNARKEARRALILLEGAKIYPQWEVPQKYRPVLLLPEVFPAYSESLPTHAWEDEDGDEFDEDEYDLEGLEPSEVVASFVEFWIDGEYDLAYSLLAADSPLREGITEEEWGERREAWADKFEPGNLETSILRETQPQKPKLWLPFSQRQTAEQKEVLAGWSLEMKGVPATEPLPDWPVATAIYAETGRHWFWASYTLIQEKGEWRIQNMTDEGVRAQSLSEEELRAKVQESTLALQKFTEEHNSEELTDLEDEQLITNLAGVIGQAIESIYYTDALLQKVPDERSLYEEAATHMFLFAQFERCLVYLLPLVERFPQDHGLVLRRVAQVYQQLCSHFTEEEDDERVAHFLQLGEQALRDSLAIEDHIEAHFSLAELLIEQGERLDEAEEQLALARNLSTSSDDEAHVELHLAEIAEARDQLKRALSHYQRITELRPDSATAWVDLADIHKELENFEEAVTSYQRAIVLDTEEEDFYSALALIYKERDQEKLALEVLQQGINALPEAADLYAKQAIIYLDRNDYKQARPLLEKARRLDPDSPLVQGAMQILVTSQPRSIKALPQPSKSSGKKKKGGHHH